MKFANWRSLVAVFSFLIWGPSALAEGKDSAKKPVEKAPASSSYTNLLPGKDAPLATEEDEAEESDDAEKPEDKRWLKPEEKPKAEPPKKVEKKPSISIETSCVDSSGRTILSTDPGFAECANRKSAQGNQDPASNPALKPGVTVQFGK